MTSEAPSLQHGNLMLDDIADWLMECALDEQTTMMDLYEGTCLRLLAGGIPVIRGHIAFRTLHPLFSSVSYSWFKDRDTERLEMAHNSDSANRGWRISPYAFLVKNNIGQVRRRLAGENSLLDFPILEEFQKNYHATDYMAFSIQFDPEAQGERIRSGVIGSWLTDRPGGFTDDDLHALSRIQQRLAVAFKVLIKNQIAINILDTYLGPDAGRRVLSGQIQRGDYETIHSVIWYSDMRNSTPLAEALSPEDFFSMVNEYFECTAGAVMAHGGEVLRFIGDAVLAIFPIKKGVLSEKQACQKAIRAMQEAEKLVKRRNVERAKIKRPLIEYGLGLHIGDVMYGNIGVPERLEFSVIGPAANETARLEALTKEMGRNVIASEKIAGNTKGNWEALGKKHLKGVSGPMALFSPKVSTGKVAKKNKR